MIFVDANVLLDITTSDANWLDWSASKLADFRDQGLTTSDIVYAEISAAFDSIAQIDLFLSAAQIDLQRIPHSALFAAGRAFARYRRQGGVKINVLPDFFIGAHAQANGVPLLTRDVGRYRTYFPDIELISP